MVTGGDAFVVEGGCVVEGGGVVVDAGAGIEVVVDAGGFAPTPRDNRGDDVGPAPTPRRGAEVPPLGSRPTDSSGAEVGPEPTPRSVPVGFTPTDRRGADVGPIPAPIKFPDVGATPRERRGSDVGPSCTPKRAPPSAAEDEDPESLPPPRTGDKRPLAALLTPPRRPLSADEAAVYRYVSHVLKKLRSVTHRRRSRRCISCIAAPSSQQATQQAPITILQATLHHPSPNTKPHPQELYKQLNCRK